MTKPWNTGLGWLVAVIGLILSLLVALGALSLAPIWLIVLCFLAILL
jgi:hypothetical protein